MPKWFLEKGALSPCTHIEAARTFRMQLAINIGDSTKAPINQSKSHSRKYVSQQVHAYYTHVLGVKKKFAIFHL